MATITTTIRLDAHLVDQAVLLFGAKNRTEAVHIALREIVAMKRCNGMEAKNAGTQGQDLPAMETRGSSSSRD